jgi:hypothetical protein
VSYRCSYCGIGDGMHITGCPGVAREEPHWIQERKGCKDCGWHVPGEHISTCPQHPRNIKKPEPVQPVAPDTYVSPHSLYHGGETPVVTPVYEEHRIDDSTWQLIQTGTSYAYPHKDWLDTREAYATAPFDPENDAIRLQAVLDCVTETNPPPGEPIAIYKPAVKPEKPPLHSRGVGFSMLAWCVYTGMYIPYGEHGHDQLALFCVINALWLTATWALRRVR